MAPVLDAQPTGSPTPETVQRPGPGLGRGLWEAPPWAIGALAAAVVLAAALYAAGRLGWRKRRRGARKELR